MVDESNLIKRHEPADPCYMNSSSSFDNPYITDSTFFPF